MGNGIKIGKVFGIEIAIDYSWFVVFALVTWSFAVAFFPLFFPQLNQITHFLLGLVASFLFFLSVVTHEVMHSLVARANGIGIKKITLFIFGGAAQISDEPPSPKAEFLMAIVGPLTSIAIGLLFILISFALIRSNTNLPVLIGLTSILGNINVILGLFNLLPGFPLDGGRVFRSIIWYFTKNLKKATRIATYGGYIIGWGLVVVGILEVLLLGVLGGFWLVLIGLFLNLAATQSYQQVVIRDALQNISVKQLMSTDTVCVEPELSLADLVNHYFLKYRFASFPVIQNGQVTGIVRLQDIQTKDRAKWDKILVKDVMFPITSDLVLQPEDSSAKAITLMRTNDLTKLPVVKNSKLVGIITQGDIVRYLSLHGDI